MQLSNAISLHHQQVVRQEQSQGGRAGGGAGDVAEEEEEEGETSGPSAPRAPVQHQFRRVVRQGQRTAAQQVSAQGRYCVD